ncbi:MAG: hypothetical protein N4A57_01580 [Anaeromicrobium sp.]|jgi:hypothetical protein|uniref:hypothetical protein n=1 Tax=Anaeromicrobium sp. TaxID=1929132 RepID=UPI0025E02DBF|nr:hypothetical protein [Anaeromicrobium sp.]MCT4592957.1 hypothetical protein [Anaeromicrobium sp.]
MTYVNTVGRQSYTANYKQNILAKNNNKKKDFNSILNKQKETENEFAYEINNVLRKQGETEYQFRYRLNNYGKKVFDLSGMIGEIENSLITPEVKTHEEPEYKVYRTFMYKPNTNNEETVCVDVNLRNYRKKGELDDKTFKNTVGKAILIIDKMVSAWSKMGITVTDKVSVELEYNNDKGEVNFDPIVNLIKKDFQSKIEELSVDKESAEKLEKIKQELEDSIFKILDKDYKNK